MNASMNPALPCPVQDALREVEENGGLLPVRMILASLVWLSARHRDQPVPDTRRALEKQLQRLAMHPLATRGDLAAGVQLAGSLDADFLRWLTAGVLGGSQNCH